MRTIEIEVTITEDGKLVAYVPTDILPGQHRAVMVIEEQPVVKKKQPPFKSSAYPGGFVDPNFTVGRDQIYDDDGR